MIANILEKYRLITVDQRRGRVRLTLLAYVVGVVVVALAVALVVYGVRQVVLASTALRPMATPVPAPSADRGSEAEGPAPTPLPVPTSKGCPTDRAQWRLVPYTLPGPDGGDVTLYKVGPPCVMAAAEQAFLEYTTARAERGRRWTEEDQVYFYTSAAFTTILSKERIDVDPTLGGIRCSESVKDDGSAVTSADSRVAFYTVAPDGLVADLLVVTGGIPNTTYVYDCATGELLEESRDDGSHRLVLFWPMVYDPDLGRWQLGRRYDVYEQMTVEQIDPDATVALVLAAQGR
jgi:hypothetical protein